MRIDETIIATGRWGNTWGREEYSINYSSILTELIQSAGRFCESYASDLFISWQTVNEILENPQPDGHTVFEFGMRQNGVDHTPWVENKRRNGYTALLEYRALYKLTVEFLGGDVTMKLERER